MKGWLFYLYFSANTAARSSRGTVVEDDGEIEVENLELSVEALDSFILATKSSSNMGPSVRQRLFRGYSL